MHVQSVPEIARELNTSYTSAQLTVSLFLLTFGVAQLFLGPLSDKIGRRPVILGGIILMGIATLGAMVAPSIEILIIARILQALGGCATLVVPRAVVQDIYRGAEAARRMAMVAMIQSLAPLIAPIIGGVLDSFFGWRSIFGFLAIVTGTIGVWAVMRLPETRPLESDGRSAAWLEIFARYGRLLSSRVYVGYTLAFAAGTSGFFGFLAVGPAIIIGEMGMAPIYFSIFLMLVTSQFPLGNYVTSRITKNMGIDRTLLWGSSIGIGAAVLLLIFSSTPSLLAFVIPMMIYAFANGMLFPNAMAGAASVDRRIAGTATSFAGFAQIGSGAVLAFTISALPTETVQPYAIALVLLTVAALVGVGLVYSGKRAK